jgi:hypothetical protein
MRCTYLANTRPHFVAAYAVGRHATLDNGTAVNEHSRQFLELTLPCR